jgi:DNA-binding transcriptional ArsR family regulator
LNENNWKILSAINHPVRREILKHLRENRALSFNELSKCVTIGNHGRVGFHLRALAGLVEHEPSTGKYQLTDAGQMAISLIEDFQFLAGRTKQMKLGAPINYVQNLVLGDHSLLLYDTEMFKREISFSFLKEGLLKRQAAFYVVSENKLDSENRQAEKHGISFDQIHSGAFTILPSEEFYLRKGKAQAKTIIANWLKLAKEKQTAGFKGLYVAAELEPFFENAKGKELLTYERVLAQQYPSTVCAICLYSTQTLEEKELVQLTKSHGHLITRQFAWKKNTRAPCFQNTSTVIKQL